MLLLFLVALYGAMFIFFLLAWRKKKTFTIPTKQATVRVSVIISARNEESTLPALLNSLRKQTYPTELWEVIIVDDHSDDATYALASASGLLNLLVVKVPNALFGKKAAIKYGVQQSEGELLLFTDADCYVGERWVEVFASHYTNTAHDFIAGPVTMVASGLFERIQAMEFMSLVHSGACAIAANVPIMANGANMAVSRTLYTRHIGDLKSEYASGDDMFLLMGIKRTDRKKIDFLKSDLALVYTKPQPTLSLFIAQRARWAGKAKGYTDIEIVLIGALVFALNMALVLCLLFGAWFELVCAMLVKVGVDCLFTYSALKFYKQQKLISGFPILFLLYPFYVLISMVFNFFPVKWKGRRI